MSGWIPWSPFTPTKRGLGNRPVETLPARGLTPPQVCLHAPGRRPAIHNGLNGYATDHGFRRIKCVAERDWGALISMARDDEKFMVDTGTVEVHKLAIPVSDW